MKLDLLKPLLLLSALSVGEALFPRWKVKVVNQGSTTVGSSVPRPFKKISRNSVVPSTRGGGEVTSPRSFHWAQAWGVLFNAFGLYPPLKTGFKVLLRLVEGGLTVKQKIIGSLILIMTSASTGKFAFSIAPKMVNRTIDGVSSGSPWHRKVLAPFVTIGLVPLTKKALKMTAIIVPSVAAYVYLTGLIPQPYQDIYKLGVYYLQLAPMGIFMVVGIARHWFESK